MSDHAHPMTPHRVFEIVGITTFTALEVWLAVRLWQAASTPEVIVILMLAALTGYLAADFGSGFAHWLFDRYGTEQTPIVGQNFIKPFREHHVDPKGMTLHDFVETNGNNCIATAPVVALGLTCDLTTRHGLFAATFCGAMSLFVFGTNQFHKWSHEDKLPGWVQFLQRSHIILGVGHHDVHHTPPFDRYYCITSGLLNPLLTRIQFFPRVEALILRTTGVRAGQSDAEYVRDRMGGEP
jgi:hypothetical protein